MYHLYSGTNDKEVSFLRTTCTCLYLRYLGTVTLPNGPLNYSKPVNGTSENTFLCLSSATRITCISSKIFLVMKCGMQSYIKRYFIVAFLIIDFPYLWEKLWLKVFPYVPFSLRSIMEYSSFKDFVVFIHIIVSCQGWRRYKLRKKIRYLDEAVPKKILNTLFFMQTG